MMNYLLIMGFISSAALILYHHLGYPLLLKWAAQSRTLNSVEQTNRHFKPVASDSELPSISILVPAYNEHRWIADKIRNLACLDYPKEKLNIYVVCDGCTDTTVEIAHSVIQEAICADTKFEIIDCKQNRGKVAIINKFVPRIKSDIIALSDVSALVTVDALLIAAEHFKNPNIGVVNACYQLFDQTNLGEKQYWQYQSKIKKAETCLGSTIGSHGAFYLFRRALFTPLESNTINDDFILPMHIVKQGYQAYYDDNIVALELEPTAQKADFNRRLRISAGNMQQILTLWPLFNPRNLGVSLAFFSGKGLRLLTPYLMIMCLTSSMYLSHLWIFEALFVAQISLYTGTFLFSLTPLLKRTFLVQMLVYLLLGHLANLIGGLRYLLGLKNMPWVQITK